MYDLRKSKLVTFVIWLSGLLLFAVAMYSRNWSLKIMAPITFFGGLEWAGWSVFSYYFGHQKGHPVRFYAIVLFALFSAGFFLNSVGAFTSIWYVCAPIAIGSVLLLLTRKYHKKFWDDYNHGVKRDHFKGSVEKIH